MRIKVYIFLFRNVSILFKFYFITFFGTVQKSIFISFKGILNILKTLYTIFFSTLLDVSSIVDW